MTDFAESRRAMVRYQLQDRGISDPKVLEAMGKVRREAFIPVDERGFAYSDGPLPIGHGQTISQPFIVALMTEALKLTGGERILEIGTGSGYAAAVLAEIAVEVFTIERIAELAESARLALKEQGYANVHVKCDDGTLGWKEHAPYDAIVATAAGPSVPKALKEQLKIGGRLVMPIGSQFGGQQLMRLTRITETDYDYEELDWVRFVPLIGEQGW
ncbi:MAG: protein-L-isoaspartate(D-aspartate) O-methyltransferase [Anderseniella sp.]|jgi:protein-L-isoaspartate(D-aspartate) O-methyltransferase|nr:protein-L-isoaspartate(D-aspartate) O-methyltransferase [Anderseniella sp.]